MNKIIPFFIFISLFISNVIGAAMPPDIKTMKAFGEKVQQQMKAIQTDLRSEKPTKELIERLTNNLQTAIGYVDIICSAMQFLPEEEKSKPEIRQLIEQVPLFEECKRETRKFIQDFNNCVNAADQVDERKFKDTAKQAEAYLNQLAQKMGSNGNNSHTDNRSSSSSNLGWNICIIAGIIAGVLIL